MGNLKYDGKKLTEISSVSLGRETQASSFGLFIRSAKSKKAKQGSKPRSKREPSKCLRKDMVPD